MLSRLNVNYLEVASKVLNEVPKCCIGETSEFCRLKWKVVDLSGTDCQTRSGHCFCASDDGTVSRRGYSIIQEVFNASFKDEAEFTESIVKAEVCRECWEDVPLTVLEKNSCIDAVTAERKVRARVRQEMSIERRARKRRARDMILIGFGYERL